MSNVKELNTSGGFFNYQKNSPLLSQNRRPIASENTSLSASQEISRSYGATRKPVFAPCNYTTVRHVLEPGDTLQGLAIKYQVTIEQIKRANRLWTDDNIHLQVYKELKIPIKLDSTYKDSSIICRAKYTETAEPTVSLNDVEFVDGCDSIKNHDSSPSSEKDQNLQDNGQIPDSGDSGLMTTNSQSLQSLLDTIDARIKKSVKESRKLRDVSGPKVLELLEKSNEPSLEDSELWRPLGNADRRSRRTKVQRGSASGARKKTSLQDSDEQFFEL